MLPENIYKQKLIESLNTINLGWIDGDKELSVNGQKMTDLVNHSLKIVIEIKDYTKDKIDLPKSISDGLRCHTIDAEKMNQRLEDQIKSANNKFKFYPQCRSALLIRSEIGILGIQEYALGGVDCYKKINGQLTYVGKKNKYSSFVRSEIGCFLLLDNKFCYFSNPQARANRILSKLEIEEIFGHSFS